ncbi:MAG: tRNA (adenosine(37)-N6)-dimethylallyltransferase MiaA [Bdellovibrionales bacterium RIFOXYA1_FULL_36_14]|nr:MAG: tRNA (adenosine(37)-N6)-dimethylallyltransferase MiaA [Bdellovibrionales bacterium RIFOXYA1_FULL_36_14]
MIKKLLTFLTEINLQTQPTIIISGPTATNKTQVSLKIATAIKDQFKQAVVIVNFDSLLFYQELSIGTAKPTPSELAMHPHELINIKSISTPFHTADFVKTATDLIANHHKNHQVVLLVGGSSFYLRALIKGMYDSHQISPSQKLINETEYKQNGISFFIDYLKQNDLASYQNLHHNDHYRIIRAVEHHMMTKHKLSDQKKVFDDNSPYDFSINQHSDWNIFHIYLDIPKLEHQEIIRRRVDTMIAHHLIEEVQNLLKQGFTGEEKPINSVGYKEVLDYLSGKIKNQNELVERIIISTRQLAKAQRTFFKKVTPKHCYHGINDEKKIIADVLEFLT